MFKKQIHIVMPEMKSFKYKKGDKKEFLENATVALNAAAQIAEVQQDTDTLLTIAGAWMEAAYREEKKPRKAKPILGFTTIEDSDRMSMEQEEEDEDE
jgi:hypothetical protein